MIYRLMFACTHTNSHGRLLGLIDKRKYGQNANTQLLVAFSVHLSCNDRQVRFSYSIVLRFADTRGVFQAGA